MNHARAIHIFTGSERPDELVSAVGRRQVAHG